MTRTRNSPFHGATFGEVDVDALTYTSTLKNLARDIHTLQDQLTGENGIASGTITHVGDGLGCPLGLPLANISLNRIISMAALSTQRPVVVAAVPIYVPRGAGRQRVRLTFSGSVPVDQGNDGADRILLRVIDMATGTDAYGPISGDRYADGHVRWDIDLDEQWGYVFEITAAASQAETWMLRSLQIYPRAVATTDVDFGEVTDDPFPVVAPAVGESLPIPTLHDEYFTDQGMISAWLVTKMSRALNNLWEYLTGSPVDGNASLVHADSAGTAPTTSRFHGGTRAGTQLAAEPLFHFPLLTLATGGVDTDGSEPTNAAITEGLIYNAPIYLHASTSATELARARVYLPHMPAANSLRAYSLITNAGKGTPTLWQARMLSSSWASYVQIGTTQYYVATITDAVHAASGDDIATVTLETQRTVAATVAGEAMHVGWHAWYHGS